MTNFEVRQNMLQRRRDRIDAANAEIAATGCTIGFEGYTANFRERARKPWVLYTGARPVRYGSLDAAKAGAVRHTKKDIAA